MVNTYHKTGRKEYVDGRLRVVYQKDKSSKQYIKRGDSYVALPASAMKKGGNGPMEVTKDNIEAAIIVYAKQNSDRYYYAFNNNNMHNLHKRDELFKTFIAPNGSRTGENLVFKNNYPADAMGYTYDNTSHKLTISKEYNETKLGKGFNDLGALIYCLDVSANTAADTAKIAADTAKTADAAAAAVVAAAAAAAAAAKAAVSKAAAIATPATPATAKTAAVDTAADDAKDAATKAEYAKNAATDAAARAATPVAADVKDAVVKTAVVNTAVAAAAAKDVAIKAADAAAAAAAAATAVTTTAADTASKAADTASKAADTASKAAADAASKATAVAGARKYMVITFLIDSQLCDNHFEPDGSNPKTGQEDFLKSGKLATSSDYDANTEIPKTTIKDALHHIHDNNSSGSKLYDYGINLYEKI